MSYQARCSCGWSGDVSGVYLNDQISCPECGRFAPVARKSTPYGYEPFTSWPSQRTSGARMPVPRPVAMPLHTRTAGGEAWIALIYGGVALFFACGSFFGLLVALPMAVLAIVSGTRARALAEAERQAKPRSALIGIFLAIGALLLASHALLGPEGIRNAGNQFRSCQAFRGVDAPKAHVDRFHIPPPTTVCEPEPAPEFQPVHILPQHSTDATRCGHEFAEQNNMHCQAGFERIQAEYSQRVVRARAGVAD